MTASLQDAYLEGQVLTADPLELVRSLYRAALDAVRSARVELAAGHIPERSREICRALTIVGELAGSLDHDRGGSLSLNLAELYDYIQRRLTDANRFQKAEQLTEVEGLLVTLLEGWQQAQVTSEARTVQIQPVETRERPSEYNAYAGFAPLPMEAGSQYTAQSWSF